MTTVIILIIAFQNSGEFSEGHSEYNTRFRTTPKMSLKSHVIVYDKLTRDLVPQTKSPKNNPRFALKIVDGCIPV